MTLDLKARPGVGLGQAEPIPGPLALPKKIIMNWSP